MAILPIYLYSDWKCTTQGQAIVPGRAGATGWAADPSNWTQNTPSEFSEDKILYTNARTIENNGGALELSGGDALYNNAVSQSIPWYNTVDTDTELNGSSNPVYNPFFTSFDAENQIAYWISIAAFVPQDDKPRQYELRLGYYNQEPSDASGSNRTSWRYWKYNTNVYAGLFYPGGNPTYWPAEFSQVKVYKLALGETDYFLFAFGVSADNRYNVQQAVTLGTDFIAIPVSFFKDKEARPWVGDTAEDDSETAFLPPAGGEWHDAITTRTNYDVNPYGVNNAGRFKVVFPTVSSGGVIMPQVLQFIITGIYRGSSENVLNQLGQVIAEITGGNANRPAEEVQAIISAIISLHSVPVIYPTGTAGSYAQVQTTFNTISGYDITGVALSITSPGQKTIFEWVYTTEVITRRLNCFLDYEPFTTLTLKLPFFPPVSLSPSAVFGHRLQVDYKIDILTGLLSADISTTDDSGNYYIITTLQGNAKTSIPIMGQGAQNAVLEKISGAIVAASKSGSLAGGAAGAISVYNEIAQSGHGVAVGDMDVDGLGAYLSPRAAYLICTHPVAAIPASYDAQGAIVGNFLDTVGMASNLGGNVGDFAGGFASFSAVDLSGVPCTDDEKREILRRLTEGVYL